MSKIGTLIATVIGIEINKLLGRILMKHLLLILSLTFIAGMANAGTSMSNNDCPFADKSNASSLFQKTAAVKNDTSLLDDVQKEWAKKNSKKKGSASN